SIYKVELEQWRAAHAVDECQHLASVLGLQVGDHGFDHHVHDLAGRAERPAAAAGLTMDADAELDLALGKLEDDRPVGRWDARGERDAERARAVVDLLHRICDLGQVRPTLRRGPGDLLGQYSGTYASATRGVERVLYRDVVIDDDRRDLDAFIGRVFRRKLEVENVARVVLDDVDDARAAIDGLRCREHLSRNGRGEDLPGGGGVEHAQPDEATVQGLV